LEVDLMVRDPLRAAKAWFLAGADMLVFHTESISLADFTRFAASSEVSVGIAALNDTSYEVLVPYLKVADYAQVMGIASIGAQGQGQDERVFTRIGDIKRDFPNCSITVDGSVNLSTIKELSLAGADRFICGSAIVAANDPKAAYIELNNLIN
jgi:ribulose-phosphate 3-epimerase